MVGVGHPFGHIHLDAAQGIGHAPDRRQVHHHVVGDRPAQFAGQFPFQQVGAPQAVEGIDFVGAVALGLDVGVAGHLGDPGDAAIHPQAGDHIGVAPSHVGAQQQDVLVGDAAPGGKGIGDGVVGGRAVLVEQLPERPRQQQSPAQAHADRHQHGATSAALAGAFGLRGSHPPKPIARSGLRVAGVRRCADRPAPARGWHRPHRQRSAVRGGRFPRSGPAPAPRSDRRGARWRAGGRSPGWCARR